MDERVNPVFPCGISSKLVPRHHGECESNVAIDIGKILVGPMPRAISLQRIVKPIFSGCPHQILHHAGFGVAILVAPAHGA
jgi:hypothetical protein